MTGRANRLTDVFKHIDMSGGREACWPWKLTLSTEGRPYFTVKGKKYLAYRLAYELVFGVELGDKMFRHNCDNPACCNPYHGTPGDQTDNMRDMKERERHGLPHTVVRNIRKLIKEGRKYETIAELYGCSLTVVKEIANNTNYSHVKDEEDAN